MPYIPFCDMETAGELTAVLDRHNLSFKAELLELDVSDDRLTFWSDFIAGCLSGGAGILTGYPLDTIKVRQQVIQTTGSRSTLLLTASERFTAEATRSLFRGMAFPLVSEGFRNSLFFGIYGKLMGPQDYKHAHRHNYAQIFVTAGIAGGVQGIAATPIELVKIQMQSQKGRRVFSGPIDCARHLCAVDGCRGLFRGLGITVGREIPALGTYMTAYTFIRHSFTPDGQHHPSLGLDLMAGGLTGVLSWMCTMPLDVLKSRIQSDSPTNPRYSGVLDCLLRSWRSDGIRVFWRGTTVTCLRAFPTNAVTLVVYSKSLAFLQGRPTSSNALL